MKYCNTCGNINNDRAKKCLNCGAKFKRQQKYSEIKYEKHVPPIEEYSKKNVFKTSTPNYQPDSTEKEWSIGGIVKDHISTKPKSMTTGVLAAFIPGLGHLYAGARKRGLQLFLSLLVVITLDVSMKVSGNWWVIPISSIGYTTLLVWSFVGTVKSIKKHNEVLYNFSQNQPAKKAVDYSVMASK